MRPARGELELALGEAEAELEDRVEVPLRVHVSEGVGEGLLTQLIVDRELIGAGEEHTVEHHALARGELLLIVVLELRGVEQKSGPEPFLLRFEKAHQDAPTWLENLGVTHLDR